MHGGGLSGEENENNLGCILGKLAILKLSISGGEDPAVVVLHDLAEGPFGMEPRLIVAPNKGFEQLAVFTQLDMLHKCLVTGSMYGGPVAWDRDSLIMTRSLAATQRCCGRLGTAAKQSILGAAGMAGTTARYHPAICFRSLSHFWNFSRGQVFRTSAGVAQARRAVRTP